MGRKIRKNAVFPHFLAIFKVSSVSDVFFLYFVLVLLHHLLFIKRLSQLSPETTAHVTSCFSTYFALLPLSGTMLRYQSNRSAVNCILLQTNVIFVCFSPVSPLRFEKLDFFYSEFVTKSNCKGSNKIAVVPCIQHDMLDYSKRLEGNRSHKTCDLACSNHIGNTDTSLS